MVELLLSCLLLTANPPPKPSPPAAPVPVEVHFSDGSTVRMALLQPALEVQTRYGRLSIPASEVRRLELGLHFPEGMEARVNALVSALGSKSFREREEASAELVRLGQWSYSAIHAAAKSKDLEVKQRAELVLKQLMEKLPAAQQRVNPEDRVETAAFPVVGKLTGVTLRARDTRFGDVELKLCDVKSIRQLSAGASTFTVDAAKFTLAGEWFDTGTDVAAGDSWSIAAEGTIDLWPATPGQYTCGPEGYANSGMFQITGRQFRHGALVCRVGDGTAFLTGEKFAGSGRLKFIVVPNPWNTTSRGTFTVKVEGR